MKNNYATPQEREDFRKGLEIGERKGLQKAEMVIRLMYSNVDEFVERILQESPETQELRKLFTGGK